MFVVVPLIRGVHLSCGCCGAWAAVQVPPLGSAAAVVDYITPLWDAWQGSHLAPQIRACVV